MRRTPALQSVFERLQDRAGVIRREDLGQKELRGNEVSREETKQSSLEQHCVRWVLWRERKLGGKKLPGGRAEEFKNLLAIHITLACTLTAKCLAIGERRPKPHSVRVRRRPLWINVGDDPITSSPVLCRLLSVVWFEDVAPINVRGDEAAVGIPEDPQANASERSRSSPGRIDERRSSPTTAIAGSKPSEPSGITTRSTAQIPGSRQHFSRVFPGIPRRIDTTSACRTCPP